MFYVQRDQHSALVRVEAQAFAVLKQLKQSDLEMIRVLDDLIQVLITKNVMSITDLPPAAQVKFLERTQARAALGGLSELINDDETGLI
ncbi:tryptophan synthase subunit beta [Pseudomonas sp. ABAC21]|nr:tryptophan synthase subunit beta [Pseudomonas sp. ABAC21]